MKVSLSHFHVLTVFLALQYPLSPLSLNADLLSYYKTWKMQMDIKSCRDSNISETVKKCISIIQGSMVINAYQVRETNLIAVSYKEIFIM